MKTHTGKKHFSCNQCPKSSSQNSDFNSCMKIHTGEKHFSCNQCPKSFSRNSDFNSHMKIRSGEKQKKSQKTYRLVICVNTRQNGKELLKHI